MRRLSAHANIYAETRIMTETSQDIKKRKKLMGERLVELCKETSEEALLDCRRLLEDGADENYGRSKPMFFAVKNYNFELIKLLIDFDALDAVMSKTHLAGMCQKGAFDKEKEEHFFECIDYAIARTGFCQDYILPYFNTMMLAGFPDKAVNAVTRYKVPLRIALKSIPVHMIVEMLEGRKEESIALINDYDDRLPEALNAAVAGGRDRAIEYIIEISGSECSPSQDSILKAVTNNCVSTLMILDRHGVDMRGDWCLVSAARVFAYRPEALKFLLGRYNNDISTEGIAALTELAQKENRAGLSEYLAEARS